MRYPLNRLLLTPAVLIALVGCAGNGEGLDQNGRPLSEGGNTPLTADFDSIQANVFTPICTQCHSGANAPRGLRLDADNSYALLVGIPSVEVPSLFRVKSGDPDSSYLVQKISGTATVGVQMPANGPPYLPQSTIDVIRQWITNGAQRTASNAPFDRTAQMIGGLRVLSTAPLAGDVVTTPLNQLVVAFDRELDVNLANSSTVLLERTDTPTTIAANLFVPIDNPSTLVITPHEPLSNGAYRLELRGAGGGALAGIDGRPLNSHIENGSGANFVIEFTVQVQP